MTQLIWLLKLALKAAIFVTLFIFALDNLHEAEVNFFFGQEWRAPLVLVLLAAFIIGLLAGLMAMVPRWWKQRRAARQAQRDLADCESRQDLSIPPSVHES